MSDREDRERQRAYRVVVNDDDQYAIWLAHKEIPAGWRDVGTSGDRDACLAYIREVWTDMRPRSVREWREGERPPMPEAEPEDLVLRLSEGRHPITLSSGNRGTWEGLRERLEMGVVHVRFTETQTEVGVRLVPHECDFTRADLERGTGEVRLVGRLVLDDVPVRCVADIALPGLSGVGRLERLGGGGEILPPLGREVPGEHAPR